MIFEIIPHHGNGKLSDTVKLVRSIPTGVPIYLTCDFPNHGEVDMLVIPQFYNVGIFQCTILAVNVPLLPKRYVSKNESLDSFPIRVEYITSWGRWKKEDNFLNFGNGFVSEKYINMIFNN